MDILAQLVSSRWQELITFLLVFGRASGLIISAPFWGSRVVPVLVRGWVALLLAVATYPLVGVISVAGGLTIFSLLMALGGEILFGLVLGWMGQLLFAAMRLAGQEMEIKSGLGLLQLVDPNEGSQSGIFGAFLELAAGWANCFLRRCVWPDRKWKSNPVWDSFSWWIRMKAARAVSLEHSWNWLLGGPIAFCGDAFGRTGNGNQIRSGTPSAGGSE